MDKDILIKSRDYLDKFISANLREFECDVDLTEKIIAGNQTSDDQILTIAIPTYNRIETLQLAVQSALDQTVARNKYNIIIVNNGQCKDHNIKVRALVESFRDEAIEYYENTQNIGMFENWNMCIELCRSKYLTILNDDDLLSTNFLEIFLQNNIEDSLFVPRVKIIGTSVSKLRAFLKSGFFKIKSAFYKSKHYACIPPDHVVIGNTIHASLGVVFDTQNAITIGGFKPELWPISDICFTHKYAKRFGITYVFDELASYLTEQNESLKPSTCKQSLIMEYFRRSDYIGSSKLSFGKLGQRLNYTHLVLKTKEKNQSLATPIPPIKFDVGENESYRVMNLRVVYFLWKLFILFSLKR